MNNINIGDTIDVYALVGIVDNYIDQEILGIYSEHALAELAWMGLCRDGDYEFIFNHHEIRKFRVNMPPTTRPFRKGDLK